MNMEDNSSLEKQLKELQAQVDLLSRNFATHRHQDTDKSSTMQGMTPIKASTVTVYSSASGPGTTNLPLQILTNSSGSSVGPSPGDRRMAGESVFVDDLEGPSEQVHGIHVAGLISTSAESSLDVNATQTDLIHSTNGNDSFFTSYRSPFYESKSRTNDFGSLKNGGNTLISSAGGFTVNEFTGATLYLYDTLGNQLSAYPILTNNSNSIVVETTFSETSGTSYEYAIRQPVYLGAADIPWRRVYLAGDQIPSDPTGVFRAIRLGNGPSYGPTATQALWVIYGFGTPLGSVTANPGSIYLSYSGSMYLKETGTDSTGWVSITGGSSSIAGRSHSTGGTSVGSGYSPTKVKLGMNDLLDGLSWDAVNYRFTVITPGDYMVCGSVAFSSTSDQNPYVVMIYVNGNEITECRQSASGSGLLTIPNITDVVKLAAGDYVELWAQSLVSSTVISSSISTFLSMGKL